MTQFYPTEIIDEVNRRLNVRKLMQAIDYRFDKYQEGPKAGKGFCPIHREGLFRNLLIDLETHTFRCQYTQCPGSKGGSLVSLFSQSMGVDMDVAVRRLVREQELDIALPVNHAWVAEELARSEELLAGGDLDGAETAFTGILDADPANPEAHHGLFKTYESRGDTERRAEKLVEVCRLKIAAGRAADVPDLIQEWSESDADSPDARFAFAELLVARGEAESAVMELMGGGDACEGVGALDAAIHAYKRAAAISQENQIDVIDVTPHIIRVLALADRSAEAVEYLYQQADAAAAAGDLESATECVILAIDAEPEREESHRRLLTFAPHLAPTDVLRDQVIQSAEFLRSHNEHEFATHALESFLPLLPDDEHVLHALINDYNNNGRAQEAFDLEARLARLLYASNRQQEAREIIDNVLTWQPQHVAMLQVFTEILEAEEVGAEARETRRRLVRALQAQGQFSEALSTLDHSALDAADPDVMELRAAALEGLGRAGDAQARDQAVAVLEELAEKHLEESLGRRALGYLQRAVDLQDEPSNELLFKMARAHLRNKDYPAVRDTVISICENLAGNDRLDEAILEAERYSNLIPEDIDLVRYLVELYLRFDDKPAAVARLRRLAQELTRSGRAEEGEEILEQANELEPKNLDSLTRLLEHYLEVNALEKAQLIRLQMAALQQEEDKHPEAAATLEQYLAEAPTDTATIGLLLQLYDRLEEDAKGREWRLQLARIHRNNGDFDREARVLRDTLLRFADDEEVLGLLMQAEFARGDMQAGVQNTLRLAAIQRKAKKTESARKTLLRAAEKVPENLDINRELFNHHMDSRQPHQAIPWGKKVIALLRTAGNVSDAAAVFDQVVALDPDNLVLKQEQLTFLEDAGREGEVAEKRLLLAQVYREQERFADAELLLEAIVRTDPRHVPARQALADLHLHLGENAQAEAQLLQIAALHHLDGEDREARVVLQSIISVNPAHTEARRQLAQIHRAEGDPAAAVDILRDLAEIYRKQQQEAEALAVEREALELDPFNEKLGSQVLEGLIAAGRHSQAAEHLERTGRHLQEKGEHEKALEQFDRIISLQPGRLSGRKLRAEVLTKLGRTEEALAELQALAELALTNPAGAESGAGERPSTARTALQIVPEYTFDQFVIGSNNDFACATALAIARSPARAYNPFFLYANVGLGKTHLCNAIANYLLERDPSANIIYTNSEDFTDELVAAIQDNDVQQFRTRYRNLDLLVVDDVQFLAGKERAQEEFFHIFNSLFQAKRQIVITSDRPPAEIAHLESRLRSRFGAGVIVDIASPDFETRVAILKREIAESNLEVPAWVPRLIAEKIDTNVRDLKGALNQVKAMRELRREDLTEATVTRLLTSLYPTASATAPPDTTGERDWLGFMGS